MRRLLLLLLAALFICASSAYAESRYIEGRAIWIDSGAIPKTERGIRDLVESYSRAGFNILLPEVFRNGYAVYPTKLAPRHPGFEKIDALEVMVNEAHKRKMEVHPWVWVFRAGHAGDIGGILPKHLEWSALSRAGEQISPGGGRWLCPSNPNVRAYLLSVYRELVTRYNVDGLHLDYIRFENEFPIPYCYNDNCRGGFKKEYGVDPMDIDPFSTMQVNWNSWRERLVNTFAQQIASELHSIHPDLKLSAAVASEPVTARLSYMQNWPNWAANKWADFLTPMTYTANTEQFGKWVGSELQAVDSETLLMPGLGLHLQKDTEITLEQIEVARKLNASGVTLFASSYLRTPTLDALRAGVFSSKAIAPFRVHIQTATTAAPTRYVAPSPPPLSIPESPLPLPSEKIQRADTPPIIDGALDEPMWQSTATISLSYTEMGKPAPVSTTAKLAYDNSALYIAFAATEPDMARLKAAQTKRDGAVFYDDSMELFLDPTGKRTVYYQLSANTLGAQFDQKLMSPAWNGQWQSAATKQADSWTMEITVPFSALGVNSPKLGDTWTANFARNRWTTGSAEYIAWSVPYGSYNRMFRFGSLVFE